MAYNFDTIAIRYDSMNHLMTLGLDKWWRRRAVSLLGEKPLTALDVACGTGDMMVQLSKLGHTATGVDLSTEMMQVAHTKGNFNLKQADAEHLPFPDASFDAVTCAFGVRNFVHLDLGLREMLRVLKPDGKLVILELSTPDNSFVRFLYNIYARRIIPMLGKTIASNRDAYTYLPRSIESFPKGDAFLQRLAALGTTAHHRKLTFGVCRLYSATINKGATSSAGDSYAINPKTKMDKQNDT